MALQRLPSYAQNRQDEDFRTFVARGGRVPPPVAAPVAPPSVVAPPVQQQATDTEVAPIAQPEIPRAPKDDSNVFEDILGGVGRFALGALTGNGNISNEIEERNLAQEQADPNSQASAVVRRRMAPVLQQLGLEPHEIATLSAADINKMSQGGDLMRAIAETRGKAKASTAAQQAKLDAEQRAAKQAVIDDERRGNTAGSKMDRAVAMAGAAGDRQAQAFAHSDEAQARAFGQAAALQGRREDAALTREERQAAREQARAARSSRIEMEKEYAAAEADLDALEDKLEARAADEALPGDENIATRAWVGVKSKVAGGSGRSSGDSLLQTDLDRAGNSAYKITNGVANTAAEQEAAKRIFRGDGTAASALQAVKENRAKLRKVQRARLSVLEAGGTAEEAAAAGRAAASGGPAKGVAAEEADLGIEVE